jgi:hypothetical protein
MGLHVKFFYIRLAGFLLNLFENLFNNATVCCILSSPRSPDLFFSSIQFCDWRRRLSRT